MKKKQNTYLKRSDKVKLWKKGQLVKGVLKLPNKQLKEIVALVLEDQSPEQIRVKVMGGLVGGKKRITEWSPYNSNAELQVINYIENFDCC